MLEALAPRRCRRRSELGRRSSGGRSAWPPLDGQLSTCAQLQRRRVWSASAVDGRRRALPPAPARVVAEAARGARRARAGAAGHVAAPGHGRRTAPRGAHVLRPPRRLARRRGRATRSSRATLLDPTDGGWTVTPDGRARTSPGTASTSARCAPHGGRSRACASTGASAGRIWRAAWARLSPGACWSAAGWRGVPGCGLSRSRRSGGVSSPAGWASSPTGSRPLESRS